MIPCELDITSISFSNTKILAYEIELPHSGRKIDFKLLDDKDFTIPNVTDIIPNLPAFHQLSTQSKLNVWIIAINGEDPITSQGVLDEINCHQTPCGRSKFNIII